MVDTRSTRSTQYMPTRAVEECAFFDLPAELIHSIYSYLDKGSITSCRLTCSRLGSTGAEHLLETAHLVYTLDRFEKLDAIYNHPIISKRVETLYYQADRLRHCELLRDCLMYGEYSCRSLDLEQRSSRWPPGAKDCLSSSHEDGESC